MDFFVDLAKLPRCQVPELALDQEAVDREKFLEDRAPLGLGGMGCQNELDRNFREGAADLARVPVRILHHLDDVFHGSFLERGNRLGFVVALPADAVFFLGQVHELEVDREGTDQPCQFGQPERADFLEETRFEGGIRFPAELDRGLPDPLHLFEEFFPFLLDQDPAERLAEEADLLTKGFEFVLDGFFLDVQGRVLKRKRIRRNRNFWRRWG